MNNISAFLEWSKEKGIVSNASVKETEYAGYGLFSTRDATDDSEPFVSIPYDLILTASKAMTDAQFAQAIARTTEQDITSFATENERLVLCLFLIYCSFFNTNTPWQPYMAILPSIDLFKQSHVLFNPDLVSGTTLETSIRTKLSSLKREYDSLTHADDWLSDIQFDMYVWANCVFWSRVVGIGEDQEHATFSSMALIPFFDFANHSSESPNIRWQLTDKGMDLVPFTSIQTGEELLLSYGSKSNQELLFLHGFCIPQNTEPFPVSIPLLPFFNPVEENLAKIRWLKQVGVKPALTLLPHSKEDAFLERDSMTTMYLVVLDEESGLEISSSACENDEEIVLSLAGDAVDSLNALEAKVKQMDMFPILQLRVIVLLQDALEYHVTLIDTPSSTDSSVLAQQASIYRSEEAATLKATLDQLTSLRDQLMQHPTVLTYLQNA
ncbi:hypothetical protein INT47_000023 [Mucor saturninus]|uniref:SET domain-containing protein n=1 Tax=Mucor saturninus TaxID=64648 RepID=A0A8H7RG91_9FUNG|nr:hypothetical protein INT47_000023 [Mucor saturninus]